MPGLVAGRGTHIEHIGRAGIVGLPGGQIDLADDRHAVPVGQAPDPVRRLLQRAGAGRGQGFLHRARVENFPGQLPTDRAVLQGQHGGGHPRVDQRLGADDRARAPGAAHHYRRAGPEVHPQHPGQQLGAGGVARTGNMTGGELRPGPAVHQRYRRTLLALRSQLVGCHHRGAPSVGQVLAEGLGHGVHPVVHLVAGLLPGLDAAGQHRHVREADPADPVAGPMGSHVVLADHHHPHRSAGQQPGQPQLEF